MNTSAHAGKNHGHDGLHHKFCLDLVARQLGDRGEAERRFPRAVRRPHVAEDERERRAQEAEERRIRRAVWGNRHRERPPPRRAQAPMCYVWYEDNQGTVCFYLARGDFDLLTPPRLKLSVLRPWAAAAPINFQRRVAERRLPAVAWQRLFLLRRGALGKPKRTLRRRAVMPDASG